MTIALGHIRPGRGRPARPARRPVRRRPRPGTWAPIAVAVMALGACQGSSAKALPAGPPVITITMTEFGYSYNHAVPNGRVIFRMVNAGHQAHEPNLFPLGEDVPPIEQQVRGDTRVVVSPFAAVAPRQPGQVGLVAVDLQPGQRYGFVCFARTPDGRTHASLGMATEFRPPGQKPPG